MDLEDLRRIWQEQDRKLSEILRADAHRAAESALRRAETSSRGIAWTVLLDLVLAAIPVIWLGSFVADHLGQPAFGIPAATLDVLAIVLLAAYARQYAMLRTLDWTGPVATIQQRLADVRVRRVRVARWILFLAPLLWALMLVVGLKGFFGIDAYAGFGLRFIAANVLFGLVFLGAAVWVSRRYGDRLRTNPFLRERLRDLAGRNLTEAERLADAAASFRRDDGPRA
ncbi:MAG TPA: hypothetical protein VKG23_10570 [Thermoanaerobaculia bacterium]|jgi:hypothetical protein|nr:hypothetical protein [Thermoanaerobaculia bacterium]